MADTSKKYVKEKQLFGELEYTSRKKRGKVEELQPGVLQYTPEHKKGVMAAVAGFMAIKRHRGRISRGRSRKRSTARPGGF